MRRFSPQFHARRVFASLALLVLLTMSGCGYGIRPPFNRDIKTVYVGIFKSQSFRHDQNIQLTQMIQDEIRLRTPYKVVGSLEGADTRLEGTITFTDKNLQVENPNNLPRVLLTSVTATVTFIDNRTGQSTTKVTPASIVGEQSPYVPEVGETASLGFQKTMQKMAKDIVSMMEEPWGAEYREDIDKPAYDPETAPIDAPRGRPRRTPLAPAQPKEIP